MWMYLLWKHPKLIIYRVLSKCIRDMGSYEFGSFSVSWCIRIVEAVGVENVNSKVIWEFDYTGQWNFN